MAPPSLSDTLQWVGSIATIAAGLLESLVAAVKYWAWWAGRRLKARIESATAFANRSSDDNLKASGMRELDWLHFAQITRIDRYDDHDALLACHQELGGREFD